MVVAAPPGKSRPTSVSPMTRDRLRSTARSVASGQSQRQGRGAPVRRAFLANPAGGRSALASLLNGRDAHTGGGGRGGRTRLALLLSLLWVASGEGHSSSRPARWWAELLGLEDPGVAGARAVKNAASELAKRRLITITPPAAAGSSATYTLLRESGDGQAYTIPDGSEQDQYFRVPQVLWADGLLADLTGSGLAAYLAVLSVYRSSTPDMWISFTDATYRNRFGLSATTRKSGLANLVEAHVLTVEQQSIDAAGGRNGRTFRRNVYQLRPWCAPRRPGSSS